MVAYETIMVPLDNVGEVRVDPAYGIWNTNNIPNGVYDDETVDAPFADDGIHSRCLDRNKR